MNNHCNSEISLALPYRIELLNIITGFVAESGQAFGANEKETFELRLAAEEVFAYIMEAFPASETDSVFHLKCLAEAGKVTFSFSDHGTPINARSTPEFMVDDIELTIGGLGLSIIKKVTDNFQCVNCGSEGWLIIFSKKLAEFRHVLVESSVPDDGASIQPVNQKLRVFRATAEHVPQLINLVYRTYRYSYAKDYFYNEQSLQQALKEERVIALVAEDEAGNIVGNVSIFFDSPQFAEIGGVMIDPQYRSGAGMLLLVKETKRLFARDTYKDTIFYVKTVTTHTYSQQLMSIMKYVPMGLRLSVYNHAKFIGIEQFQGHRESLVFAIRAASLTGKTPIFNIPAIHKDIVAEIIDNAGITADLDCAGPEIPTSVLTALSANHNEKAQFVEIDIGEIGLDFAAVLKKETFSMQQDGYLTCLVNIPIDKPLPANMDDILKQNKFFFSGLQLNKQGNWQLMYTNLFHQRFQFANVKLYDPFALKLRDYIEGQYLSIY